MLFTLITKKINNNKNKINKKIKMLTLLIQIKNLIKKIVCDHLVATGRLYNKISILIDGHNILYRMTVAARLKFFYFVFR